MNKKFGIFPMALWGEETYRQMSPEYKTIANYIITGPQSSSCGISPFEVSTASFYTGLRPEALEIVFEGLISQFGDWFKYDPETGEIAYLQFANQMRLGKMNAIQEKMFIKDLDQVESVLLLRSMIANSSSTNSKPYLKRLRQIQAEAMTKKRLLKEIENAENAVSTVTPPKSLETSALTSDTDTDTDTDTFNHTQRADARGPEKGKKEPKTKGEKGRKHQGPINPKKEVEAEKAAKYETIRISDIEPAALDRFGRLFDQYGMTNKKAEALAAFVALSEEDQNHLLDWVHVELSCTCPNNSAGYRQRLLLVNYIMDEPRWRGHIGAQARKKRSRGAKGQGPDFNRLAQTRANVLGSLRSS